MRKIITAALVLGVMGFGCTPPKLLIQKGFIDSSKSIAYLMQQSGTAGSGDNKAVLYSYSIEICNLESNGRESSCVESLILENVRLSPHYR